MRILADPPSRGGTPASLRELTRHARSLVNSVSIAADVPEVREELIETLVKAVREANEIAKVSSTTTEKGSGGMPGKARWYQLVGYLAQVLDSVCKNVELSEINERLLKVEKELGVAKARPSQTRGTT